jgi:electron transport complex protein RnfA
MEYFAIIIGAIFVSNIVLAQFLGICPFVGVSGKLSTSVGMGGAVLFVMTLATIVTWVLQYYVLNPFGLGFMQTIVFILVIASLVQMVEIILKKVSPPLYQALGVFLPLITTNCAVLGVAILTIQKEFNLMEGVVFSIANAIGFTLAIVLFSSVREHLDLMEVPKGMRGVPIALVVAGILALAFMGFTGLV